MSLRLNKNISDIYVGGNKINSIYVGESLVYSSAVKLDCFHFQIDDPTQTAEVGIKELVEYYKNKSEATDVPVDRSKFTDYITPTFEYSFDKKFWVNYTLGNPISIGQGQVSNIVYFRGDNLTRWNQWYTVERTETISDTETTVTHYYDVAVQAFINDASVRCGGSIMSLRYKNFENQDTIPCEACFNTLFYGCANLKKAPLLPATVLAPTCYGGARIGLSSGSLNGWYGDNGMFSGCTSLTSAPELPATTLATRCYGHMFSGCTSLTSAPELSATTLAESCYINMFVDTSLTSAPELPATTLAENCYTGMFSGTSLTFAPELPATTLAVGCYVDMFSDTPLTSAPELPATTLAVACYAGMFGGTSLTSAPELPATTLAENCYTGMFSGCTSLTSAPELPATTLAAGCYGTAVETLSVFAHSYSSMGMFSNCISLTSAPELPATVLAESCYGHMFKGCTSLTSTPLLPATTLAKSCYYAMFKGCTALTRISKLKALNIPDGGIFGTYASMFANSSVRANSSSSGVCNKAYRIPESGTGTAGSKDLDTMFVNLAGDGTFTPTINTTFYINVASF